MKRRLGTWLPIIVVFVLFALVRRDLDLDLRATGSPALDDAPSSLYGVFVFGAFKPLFVEELWSQVDRYEREGRFWELIDAQERLLRLTPEEPRIWYRQVQVLAYGIAQNEPEDRLRWRWYRRALTMLDAGTARHPADFDLAELRFRIEFGLIAGDPYCARQAAPGRDGGALLLALKTAARLRRDFADRPAARDAYRNALEESAEFLMNKGRFRESRELVMALEEELFGQPWPFPEEPLRPGLKPVLDFALDALAALNEVADWRGETPRLTDPDRLLIVLDRLAQLMEPSGPMLLSADRETFDLALTMHIHVRGLSLCQAALLAKNHDVALRLIPALNRIATLAEGRVGSGMPYYSRDYVEALRAFIALDAELMAARTRGEEAGSELAGRWRHELDELDRLISSRAGRSDSFSRRLMDSRR